MNGTDWDSLRKAGERLGVQFAEQLLGRLGEVTSKPPRTEPTQGERDLLRKLHERNAEIENLRLEQRRAAETIAELRAGQRDRDEQSRHDELLAWHVRQHESTTPKLDRLFSRPTPFTDHEEAPVTPSTEDDPYPRFWRWSGGGTHFYRVDDPNTVYFKFRSTDNWTRAGSLREHDCGPHHAPPLERDWDNPDDPRDRSLPLEAARRPRRFRRAGESPLTQTANAIARLRASVRREIGHGAIGDSHSHEPDVVTDEGVNVDIVAALPGDWPRTIHALLREVDLNDGEWRDLLKDALLSTIDDWVTFGQRHLLPYLANHAGDVSVREPGDEVSRD